MKKRTAIPPVMCKQLITSLSETIGATADYMAGGCADQGFHDSFTLRVQLLTLVDLISQIDDRYPSEKDRPAGIFFSPQWIDNLYKWNSQTFGPGMRTKGVIDHIRKELVEIEEQPTDPEEWVDVLLLALNGLQRLGIGGWEIKKAIMAKVKKNMGREWPDWQTADPEKAINHVKQ